MKSSSCPGDDYTGVEARAEWRLSVRLRTDSFVLTPGIQFTVSAAADAPTGAQEVTSADGWKDLIRNECVTRNKPAKQTQYGRQRE